MSGSETTVREVTPQSVAETEQFRTERSFLESFAAELEPDDEVWIVGARGGAYAALAARVVGARSVAVFEDDPDRRAAVRATLDGAGLGAVGVEPLVDLPEERPRPAGDPGVGDGTSEPPTGVETPTVLVLDEPAAGRDLLSSLSVGHTLSVRYLLVKSESRDAARRLGAAGYETTRLRRFDPLRTPWMQVVEARRNPDLPVKPVASSVVNATTAGADGRAGTVGEYLLGAVGVDPGERPRLAMLATGLVRLVAIFGGLFLVAALGAAVLIAGVGAAGGGVSVELVTGGVIVVFVLLFALGGLGAADEEGR